MKDPALRKWVVKVRGEGFYILFEDGVQPAGWYTTRYVEAETAELAENMAIDLIRDDRELQSVTRNTTVNNPMMYVLSIKQVDSFEGVDAPGKGYAFYRAEHHAGLSAHIPEEGGIKRGLLHMQLRSALVKRIVQSCVIVIAVEAAFYPICATVFIRHYGLRNVLVFGDASEFVFVVAGTTVLTTLTTVLLGVAWLLKTRFFSTRSRSYLIYLAALSIFSTGLMLSALYGLYHVAQRLEQYGTYDSFF